MAIEEWIINLCLCNAENINKMSMKNMLQFRKFMTYAIDVIMADYQIPCMITSKIFHLDSWIIVIGMITTVVRTNNMTFPALDTGLIFISITRDRKLSCCGVCKFTARGKIWGDFPIQCLWFTRLILIEYTYRTKGRLLTTVECRYNATQFITISHMALRW